MDEFAIFAIFEAPQI